MHTIEIFNKYEPKIELIIVLPEQQIKTWKNLCYENSFNINHRVCIGGKKRFFSVLNGLKEITEEGIVFIHDGVRPLVSIDTLLRCCRMAQSKGNAIPVIPVAESLRKGDNVKNVAVNRSEYYIVQTPQTFNVAVIKEAYNQEFSPLFTDDASVLEVTGKSINLVEGNRENIKITFPNDILIAEVYLK